MYDVKLYDTEKARTFDISNQSLSLAMNETLDRDVTTWTLVCKDVYDVHLFNHLTIKKDSNILLTGIVLEQEDMDSGGLKFKVTTMFGEDWGHLLSKRIVAEVYDNADPRGGKPDLILKHMLQKYAPEFDTTYIDSCSTVIDYIEFRYCTVKEAIEQLMDLLPDWHWYISRTKGFHFFYKYESDGSAFTIQNIDIKTLKVKYSGQEHANKVWIVGRKQGAPTPIDFYFTLDGQQRFFSLPYEPVDLKIFVGGSEKNISLESNDDGARDFLYNKSKRVFYIPNYKSPFTGQGKATFRPVKQFVDYYENPTDVKKNGLMEKAITNSAVVDKIEARRYGMSEVKKNSVVKRVVTFKSKQANVSIGQRCRVTVNSEYWDVDGFFLVKSVKRDIQDGREFVNFELEELL